MQAKRRSLHLFISTLVCSMLLATLVSTAPLIWGNRVDAAPADQIFKTHLVQIQPVYVRYNPTLAGTVWNASTAVKPVRFACQSNTNPQPSLCYGPYQIRQAYGVTNLLKNQQITGKGSAITIIDAYGSPNIRKDLQA